MLQILPDPVGDLVPDAAERRHSDFVGALHRRRIGERPVYPLRLAGNAINYLPKGANLYYL